LQKDSWRVIYGYGSTYRPNHLNLMINRMPVMFHLIQLGFHLLK
jgi:hypothetical protein